MRRARPSRRGTRCWPAPPGGGGARQPCAPLARAPRAAGADRRHGARSGSRRRSSACCSRWSVAFARSAARFGPASMATVGIVNRIEAIQFMAGGAIRHRRRGAGGAEPGAQQPARAVLAIWTGVRWVVGLALVLSAVLIAFPQRVHRSLHRRSRGASRRGALPARTLDLPGVRRGRGGGDRGDPGLRTHARDLVDLLRAVSLLRIPLAFWVPDWTGSGVVGIAWLISAELHGPPRSSSSAWVAARELEARAASRAARNAGRAGAGDAGGGGELGPFGRSPVIKPLRCPARRW